MVYLKLSLFKQKQRILSLIPFSGLASYLKSTYKLNNEILNNDQHVNLRWFQKIFQSNKIVFQIKLTSAVVYISLFYLLCLFGFAIFTGSVAFIDANGYKLKWTSDNNAYVIDLRPLESKNEELWARRIGSALLIIPIIMFIGFAIGVILDKNPYVLSPKVRKNKFSLSLTLLVIEIVQLLILVALIFSFIFISNTLFVQRATSAVFQIEATGILLSKQDMFMIGIGFMISIYLSWFIIYAKVGMFSRSTRILAFIPFASLFLVNKYAINANEEERINGFKCQAL